MIKERIVLGNKVSHKGLEVDRSKVEVIEKLPHPVSMKGVRSFLKHIGFYRCFIKDFSKIASPICKLLEKEAKFDFGTNCQQAFEVLKKRLIAIPILISPDWALLFELMCDASDMSIRVVLVQRKDKVFHSMYYISKVVNTVQVNYTVTEKEM